MRPPGRAGGLPNGLTRILTDDAGSTYPLTVYPALTAEAAKLTASDGEYDQLGWSVSIYGDTVVVGAFFSDVGADTAQGTPTVFVTGTPKSLHFSRCVLPQCGLSWQRVSIAGSGVQGPCFRRRQTRGYKMGRTGVRLGMGLVVVLSSVGWMSDIAAPVAHAASLPASGRMQVDRPGEVPEGLSPMDWDRIREQIREAEYQYTWHDSSARYVAPNRRHGLHTKLGAGGLQVSPALNQRDAGWGWGMRLAAWGVSGKMRAVRAEPVVRSDGSRVELDWGGGLTEWYVNEQRGVEQGFTIQSPPEGVGTAGGLVLEMSLVTDLSPRLSVEGLGVVFEDAKGEKILRYDELHVFDATGKAVPAWFEVASAVALCPAPQALRRTPYALHLTPHGHLCASSSTTRARTIPLQWTLYSPARWPSSRPRTAVPMIILVLLSPYQGTRWWSGHTWTMWAATLIGALPMCLCARIPVGANRPSSRPWTALTMIDSAGLFLNPQIRWWSGRILMKWVPTEIKARPMCTQYSGLRRTSTETRSRTSFGTRRPQATCRCGS